MQKDVIIIGGGVSGLAAANYLEDYGWKPMIIEATSRVGGRVKTDQYEGFLLDRGFQVFLTAYPEAKHLLDYEGLKLEKFSPGALILKENGTKDLISDPMRDISTLFSTIFAQVGSFSDKLKMLSLKNKVTGKSIETIFEGDNTPTAKYLQDFGFSDEMINSFFAPFFGSIFLEKDLKTSRKMFEFVFKMFSEGFATIPKNGIGQIPIQLKSKLNLTEIKYNERVTHIENNKVYTNKNECYEAKAVLIATEAVGLVRNYKKDINTKYQGTSVMYFSAEQSPIKGKYIALNASKSKLINNIAVPSNISSAYAPKGKHLISLSTIGLAQDGQAEYIDLVKTEMKNWFGAQVDSWKYLKTYHIPYSLPRQENVTYNIDNQATKIGENLYMCGDAFSNSSLNAAMKSGRVAAAAINEQLKFTINN